MARHPNLPETLRLYLLLYPTHYKQHIFSRIYTILNAELESHLFYFLILNFLCEHCSPWPNCLSFRNSPSLLVSYGISSFSNCLKGSANYRFGINPGSWLKCSCWWVMSTAAIPNCTSLAGIAPLPLCETTCRYLPGNSQRNTVNQAYLSKMPTPSHFLSLGYSILAEVESSLLLNSEIQTPPATYFLPLFPYSFQICRLF